MSQAESGSMIRVGVVGLGRSWSDRYRAALARPEARARVVAVCDPVTHRAEAEADRLGCDAVEGLTAMVDRPDVEAVVLLDSPWFGPWPIRVALDRGKPVFSAVGHRATLDALASRPDDRRRDDPPAMLGFSRRRSAGTRRLLELLATDLGPPRRLTVKARVSVPDADFPGDRPPDGPADAAIELVDWCRALFQDDPTDARLVARADRGRRGLRVVDLSFPDGGSARLTLLIGPTADEPDRVEGECPARLLVEADRGRARLDRRGLLFRTIGGVEVEERLPPGSPTDLIIDSFLRLVRGERSHAQERDELLKLDRTSRVFAL